MKQHANKRPAYEPPVLKVLGTASELTLGPSNGPNSDGLFPHHTSA